MCMCVCCWPREISCSKTHYHHHLLFPSLFITSCVSFSSLKNSDFSLCFRRFRLKTSSFFLALLGVCIYSLEGLDQHFDIDVLDVAARNLCVFLSRIRSQTVRNIPNY